MSSSNPGPGAKTQPAGQSAGQPVSQTFSHCITKLGLQLSRVRVPATAKSKLGRGCFFVRL
eukprot:1192295-Prorocentrum_minimum.AAC.1